MSAEMISDRLREIFANELGLDIDDIDDTLQYSVTPEWDSVGHMHLIAAIEEVFSIEIPDNDVAGMTTFSKVAEAVSRFVGEG